MKTPSAMKVLAMVLAVAVLVVGALRCGPDWALAVLAELPAPGAEALLPDLVVPVDTLGAPSPTHDIQLVIAPHSLIASNLGLVAVFHTQLQVILARCLLSADESRPKRLLSMRRDQDTKYKDLLGTVRTTTHNAHPTEQMRG